MRAPWVSRVSLIRASLHPYLNPNSHNPHSNPDSSATFFLTLTLVPFIPGKMKGRPWFQVMLQACLVRFPWSLPGIGSASLPHTMGVLFATTAAAVPADISSGDPDSSSLSIVSTLPAGREAACKQACDEQTSSSRRRSEQCRGSGSVQSQSSECLQRCHGLP